jgi:hypothetical protein
LKPRNTCSKTVIHIGFSRLLLGARRSAKPLDAWRQGSLVKALSLVLGATAAGMNADAARALEPAASWCVIRHDSADQPACYENLLSCVMAALAHASSCTQLRSPGPPSQNAKQRTTRVGQLPEHRAHASPRHHKLTAEERDELFREFQQWKERSTHE